MGHYRSTQGVVYQYFSGRWRIRYQPHRSAGHRKGRPRIGDILDDVGRSAGNLKAQIFLLCGKQALALIAIHDSEIASESQGINARGIKLTGLLVCGIWCQPSGRTVFPLKSPDVAPDAAFSVNWTSFAIFLVMIGGLGACAAEGMKNARRKFDLSERSRSDFFEAGKGARTPENVRFRLARFLPRRLLGAIEAPIVGAVIFWALNKFLSNYGTCYLVGLDCWRSSSSPLSSNTDCGVICKHVFTSAFLPFKDGSL
jgi:hypothetical protein